MLKSLPLTFPLAEPVWPSCRLTVPATDPLGCCTSVMVKDIPSLLVPFHVPVTSTPGAGPESPLSSSQPHSDIIIASTAKEHSNFFMRDPFMYFHPTSGVRGPDTLWRVPWTPLLGSFFFLVFDPLGIPQISSLFCHCIPAVARVIREQLDIAPGVVHYFD